MQVIFFTFRASQESLNPLIGIVVLVRAREVVVNCPNFCMNL